MRAAGFEPVRSGDGLGVAAWGSTPGAAFAQAALGVFALMVEPGAVRVAEAREVRAHGADLGGLLVQWINECLYLFEVEGFVPREVEMVAFQAAPAGGGEPLRLHALLRGEEVDPARHRLAVRVAACLPPATVSRDGEAWRVRLRLET